MLCIVLYTAFCDISGGTDNYLISHWDMLNGQRFKVYL